MPFEIKQEWLGIKKGETEREREKGEREREREKKEGRRMWVDEGGLAGAGVQGKSFLP